MCGRFTLLTEEDVLRERFLIGNMEEVPFRTSYNIAPSQEVLTVINDGKQNRAGFLKWGLVPGWAKDPKIGYKMINARAETISEKPSFRAAFRKRRCLILADGFYEWKREAGKKIPVRIMLKDSEPFAFAGLWEKWSGKDGNPLHTCTIITTKANEMMEPIHDRMPVILNRETEKIWLDRSVTDPEVLQHCLVSYPSEGLTSYHVPDIVNSPKNDIPDCIASIDKTS